MFAAALNARLARSNIHYGWVMVALTFLTMLSTSAAMGMPGVLMTPIRDEFHWSAATVSGALALRIALYGLIAPFAAALIARYGLRVVVAAAMVLIVGGIALATRMTTPWQMWLTWGLLVGLGTGMTAMVLGATVASRWFDARRGLVIGVLTASAATGSLIFLPLAAHLAEMYGWRWALVPPACACALAGFLVILFGRDHPADLGLAPFGGVRVLPTRLASGDAVTQAFGTLREAAGSRTFWLLFGTFFVCGLSTNGLVGTHFVSLCRDYGMDATAAAGVLALMGACDFVGTIGSGWLTDRMDSRLLLFAYYGLRGLSLMALPFSAFTFHGLSLFGVFYGLDWIATVPPTVRLAGAEFGREKAALVFGWVFCGHQLGAAVATYGAGWTRDAWSSYLPAFFAAGVMCLLAAVASLAIGRRGVRRAAVSGKQTGTTLA